jgi:hypothetical protein
MYYLHLRLRLRIRLHLPLHLHLLHAIQGTGLRILCVFIPLSILATLR